MKRKKFFVFVILILLVTAGGIQAKKIALLSGLMKPDMMVLEYDRIFITGGVSIYIYSLKELQLIKKFGKEGEGPREFKASPTGPPMMVVPANDKLFVTSQAKVSVFTKDGEFIKETKVMPYQLFWPFKNKFINTGNTSNDKDQMVLSVNLCNEKFEREKEIYVSDFRVGSSVMWDFPVNIFTFRPYKDRIYLVVGKEGFVIDIFDEKGTKLQRIKKDYQPLKVPREYKDKTLDWFRTDPFYKQYWEYFKTRITFKSDYPPIRDMFVEGERIYVLTYKRKNGNSECIIMDLQGNERKRVFVPVPEMLGMDYYAKYDIYNRGFYTLVENEGEEVWELHRSDALK
jgi:hypothetical protein